MSILIKVEALNAINALKGLSKGVSTDLIDLVDRMSQNMTKYVQRRFLSGAGSDSIGVESGALRDSAKPLATKNTNLGITGGVSVGGTAATRKYAGTLITKGKKTTTVRATNKKYLTIPLPIARRSGKGALSLGSKSVVKKIKTGKYTGDLIMGTGGDGNKRFTPYFLLTKSVEIESKVDTNEVTRRYKPVASRMVSQYMKSLGR